MNEITVTDYTFKHTSVALKNLAIAPNHIYYANCWEYSPRGGENETPKIRINVIHIFMEEFKCRSQFIISFFRLKRIIDDGWRVVYHVFIIYRCVGNTSNRVVFNESESIDDSAAQKELRTNEGGPPPNTHTRWTLSSHQIYNWRDL